MKTLALVWVLAACWACSSTAGRREGGGGPDPELDAGGADRAVVVVPPGADGALPPYQSPFDAARGARLVGSTADVDLGTLNIGSVPRSAAIVIMNTGNEDSATLVATLMSGAELRLTSNCMGRRLRPSETCVVTAEFEPTSVGPKTASGTVSDGAGQTISFMARAVGRAAPDAGPDVARMGLEVGAPADTAAPPPRDAGIDVARDTGADVARDSAPVAADAGTDARD